jgi:hypothetical protein
MALSDADLEGRLRDLRVRADELPPAPADLAGTIRARHHRQRRTELRLAAAGLAVMLLFIGVPVITSALSGSGSETANPSSTTAGETEKVLLDEPTRGSLATDDAWLAGVAARDLVPSGSAGAPATGAVPEESVELRTTAFAGDVPGGRVALVVAMLRDGDMVQAWFTGPTGAGPTEMALTEFGSAPSREPLALLDVPDPATGRGVLVVVAFPGDEVEVKIGQEVTASGEIRERWQPVPTENGAGALGLDVPISWAQQNAQLRIAPEGEDWQHTSPRLSQRAIEAEETASPDLADPRGLRGLVDEGQLRTSVEHLVARFGSSPAELGLTILAAGPVGGTTANTLLLGATFPSGATTGLLAVYPSENGVSQPPTVFQSMTSTVTAPAGTALLDRVFAVELAEVLTVSGPMTGTQAEVYDDAGTLLATVPLVQGAGAGFLPPQVPTLVRILDGSGALVTSAPVTQPGE